jgi:hypothetical protein
VLANLKATDAKSKVMSLPQFLVDAISSGINQNYFLSNIFFLLRTVNGQSTFEIFRRKENSETVNLLLLFSIDQAPNIELSSSSAGSTVWICFRIILMPTTGDTLNFDLIIVGVAGGRNLRILLVKLEIPKSKTKVSNDFQINLWKTVHESNSQLEITGVQIGRIENMTFGKLDGNFLLFLTNGESILEYKLKLVSLDQQEASSISLKKTSLSSTETSPSLGEKISRKIQITANIKYNAIGVCTSGGTIKLYYRSDYLLFLCNMDKFGNMESAVSIFRRSLALHPKLPDSNFFEANPISIIQQHISIAFKDFDLKLSPNFELDKRVYISSPTALIEMFKIDGDEKIAFEDVSAKQKRRVVNFKIQIENLFET